MSSPPERASVEYESRLVRLGSATYQLCAGQGGWSVIDGFGGRTIGRARLRAGAVECDGEDPELTARVLHAWIEHCGAQKKEPWPRLGRAAAPSPPRRSDPIPVDALRDLLGLVRSMWRAAKADGAPPHELARFARVGAELVSALRLARASTNAEAHAMAWEKAERATNAVADLVTCIDSAEPIVKAAVVAVERRRR